MKRVIRSDKPVTLLLLLWSHKCDIGAEPRSRIIATSAVKGLKGSKEETEGEGGAGDNNDIFTGHQYMHKPQHEKKEKISPYMESPRN
jgi:hypothetical protein